MSAPIEPGRAQAPQASVGELFGEISRDLSTLVRQEIALAKAETTDSARKAGASAGMYGGAGVAGHFVLLFLSLAVWWGLGWLIGGEDWPSLGWSGLIVAIVWAVVAAVLYAQGKKKMQQVRGVPQTAETVKRIPDALKGEDRP